MRRVASVPGFYTPYAHDVTATASSPDVRLPLLCAAVGVVASAGIKRVVACVLDVASRGLSPACAVTLLLLAAAALAWRLTWCAAREACLSRRSQKFAAPSTR
jgi:hypothetical protein